VTPERYMQAIAALQPDMYVALADEVSCYTWLNVYLRLDYCYSSSSGGSSSSGSSSSGTR
jgi:uncharacterized membrane protein YgcG